LKEIRWHGRGGNGAFTAAKLLGLAASVFEGKYSQAFPSFGPERRGAPVMGFNRISDDVITDHSQVYECDCVVVLDETLCDVTDVTAGMKEHAVLVVNTQSTAEQFKKEKNLHNVKHIFTLDATGIALERLGRPIVNTVMLGAALGATQLVSWEALEKAIEDMMGGKLGEINIDVAKMAYDTIKEDATKC